MTNSLAQSIDYIDYLVEEMMQVTEHNLNGSASAVLLVDRDFQELRFEYVHGPIEGMLKGAAIGVETGLEGWVAHHGEPVVVDDVSEDQRFYGALDEIAGFVTKSIICVPLFSQDRVIGVVEVINKSHGSKFTEQDLHTVQAIAPTLARAVELKITGESVLASVEDYRKVVGNLTGKELRLLSADGTPREQAAIDHIANGLPLGIAAERGDDDSNGSDTPATADRRSESLSVEAEERAASIIAEVDDRARQRRHVILGWDGVATPGPL